MKPPEEGNHHEPEFFDEDRESRSFRVFVKNVLKPSDFDSCDVGPDDFGALVLDEHNERGFFKGFDRDEWLF